MKKPIIELLVWVVIGSLFLSPLGCDYSGEFVLKIIGGKADIGASVYINGQLSGRLKQDSEVTSSCSIELPVGKYTVEIKRGDHISYKEEIDVQRGEAEYYISLTAHR